MNKVASVLKAMRGEGFWVLALLSAFPSLDLWRLFKGWQAAQDATRVGPGEVALAILAVAAAVEIFAMKRRWRRAVPPVPAIAFVAVGLLAAVCAPRGASVKSMLVELVQWVEIFLIGLGWFLWARGDKTAADRATKALAAAATVHVITALVQLAAGKPLFEVRGLFSNRNHLGVFLAVTAPLFTAQALAPGRKPWERAWLGLVVGIGLLITSSGGLVLAMAVGILAAAGVMKRPRALIAAGGVAFVLLLLQPVLLPGVRSEQLRTLELFPRDEQGRARSSARARRIQAAVNLIRKRPVLGVGPGQFQHSIGSCYEPPYDKPQGRLDDVSGFNIRADEPGSQSVFVVTACETGLLGAFALLWFVASLMDAGARGARASSFAAGCLGAAVGMLIAGLFSSFLVRGVALPMVLVAALGIRSDLDGWSPRREE